MLAKHLSRAVDITTLSDMHLRFTTPASVCSYCTGETRIGEEFQNGMMKKMTFSPCDVYIKESGTADAAGTPEKIRETANSAGAPEGVREAADFNVTDGARGTANRQEKNEERGGRF